MNRRRHFLSLLGGMLVFEAGCAGLTLDTDLPSGPDAGVRGDAGRDSSTHPPQDAGSDAGDAREAQAAPQEEGGDASDGGDADAADGADGTGTIVFASGPDWESFGADYAGEDLGPAQEVCANSSIPDNCPLDAVNYNARATGGWTTFQNQPDVHWIWLGNVQATQLADSVVAGFTKTFTLGAGALGQIAVGADDSADVYINQVLVGSIGSTSNEAAAEAAQNSGAVFDISAALRAGENTITIVAQNGPGSFAGNCPGGCTYTQNTAGVAFAGTISW